VRAIICKFRGHDWERIGITGALFNMPDAGPVFPMKPDPHGVHGGCRRCGQVRFHLFDPKDGTDER
jgi:hypothetical protein